MTPVKNYLRNARYTGGVWNIDAALAFFAPHDCVRCGQEGSLLCSACCQQVPWYGDVCFRCLKSGASIGLCENCRPKSSLDGVWITTAYQAAPRALIQALKFSRAKAGAQDIARLMAKTFPEPPAPMVLVPIPTISSHVRSRGYDQAALIARHLAKHRHMPVHALIRRHGQTRQLGASRKQRHQQLAGVFYCSQKLDPNTNYVLVDDVVTTGATIEHAAQALRAAGATKVYAAVFAQKQ